MRSVFGILSMSILAGLASVVNGDPIIFDRGPDATTANTADVNLTNGQNLAGMFELSDADVLTGYELFAIRLVDPSETFHFKLLADASGKPGMVLASQDLLPASVVLIPTHGGNQIYSMYDYSFSLSPLALAANTTYWVGLSGNGSLDPGQWDTIGNPSTLEAIFSGPTFQTLNNPQIGQMFQLEGHPVPEPAAAAVGSIIAALLMRRPK